MLGLLFILVTLSTTHGALNQLTGLDIDVGSNPYWAYLKWNKATESEVTKYEIQYWEIPQTRPATQIEVPATRQNHNITDIKSGTSFNLRIRSISASEQGPWSTIAAFVTTGPKPPASVNIADIRDVSALVQWTPDANDSPDFYKVYVVENSQPPVITPYPRVPNTVTFSTAQNLKPSTPYTIRVTAIRNDIESSFATNGFRTGSVSMQPPTGLRMSDITPVTATLNWNRITDTTDVNHFDIEISDSNRTSIIATSNDATLQLFRIQNLSPGMSYFVRIRTSLVFGTNNIVKGRWSEKIAFTTVQAQELREPTRVDPTPLKDRVNIKWEAVSTAAGQQIASYVIEYTMDFSTGKSIETGTANTFYTLTGLMSGTQYSFRMAAKDNFGTVGKFTTWVVVETNGPKPVTSISITEIRDKTARISWTVHSDSNYDQVRMRVKNNNADTYLTPDKIFTKVSQVTTYNLQGLSGSTPYTIEMTTELQGDPSSVTTNGFRTDSSTGSIVPKNARVERGSKLGEVIVSCDRLSGVAQYQVRARTSGKPAKTQSFDPTTSSTRQVMTMKLNTGYQYSIDIRARTTQFYGAYSSPANTITIPGGRAPISLNVYDVSDKSVKITWISAYPSSQTVTHVITLRAQGNVVERKEVTQGPVTFEKGILSNIAYTFEVQSKGPTDNQLGDITSKTFMTPIGTPNQPFFTAISTTPHTATFSWQLIPNRNDILYYEIELTRDYLGRQPTVHNFKTDNPQQNSFRFPSLDPRVLYAARVRGVARESSNFNSKGYYSTLKIFSVIGDLPGPTIKEAKADGTSILVKWDTGNTQGILYYELEITTINSDVTTTARTPSVTGMYEITDLHPGTNYRIRVRAVATEGGKGQWSAVMMAKTGGKATNDSSKDGMSSGEVAGIVVAVMLIVIIILVAAFVIRKRNKKTQFDRFENGSVKFSKGGQSNGSLTHEMDERAATAIKPGNGVLYT